MRLTYLTNVYLLQPTLYSCIKRVYVTQPNSISGREAAYRKWQNRAHAARTWFYGDMDMPGRFLRNLHCKIRFYIS